MDSHNQSLEAAQTVQVTIFKASKEERVPFASKVPKVRMTQSGPKNQSPFLRANQISGCKNQAFKSICQA